MPQGLGPAEDLWGLIRTPGSELWLPWPPFPKSGQNSFSFPSAWFLHSIHIPTAFLVTSDSFQPTRIQPAHDTNYQFIGQGMYITMALEHVASSRLEGGHWLLHPLALTAPCRGDSVSFRNMEVVLRDCEQVILNEFPGVSEVELQLLIPWTSDINNSLDL
jgi:hypothetical protein